MTHPHVEERSSWGVLSILLIRDDLATKSKLNRKKEQVDGMEDQEDGDGMQGIKKVCKVTNEMGAR